MRVAYFNEFNTLAANHELGTGRIINGVRADPRIGTYCNNPSFGYGGYSLHVDTKQLLANYCQMHQNLIQANIDADATRERFVAFDIVKRNPKMVGIHRMVKPTGSDSFRASSVQGVIKGLKAKCVEVIDYEPAELDTFCNSRGVSDLSAFKAEGGGVTVDRVPAELDNVRGKVYNRGLFGGDA